MRSHHLPSVSRATLCVSECYRASVSPSVKWALQYLTQWFVRRFKLDNACKASSTLPGIQEVLSKWLSLFCLHSTSQALELHFKTSEALLCGRGMLPGYLNTEQCGEMYRESRLHLGPRFYPREAPSVTGCVRFAAYVAQEDGRRELARS